VQRHREATRRQPVWRHPRWYRLRPRLRRAGFTFGKATCLLVGSGGAGAAIAAALVAEGIAYLGVNSRSAGSAAALVGRLGDYAYRSDLRIELATNDPSGYDLIVNATPLGMNDGDPLPIDVTRLTAGTMVADIVMGDVTPLLRAAAACGCKTQPGTKMLVEQAPSVLELWGFGAVAPEEIRQLTDALGWQA
jgi:shikimate dehydrogenase